MRASGIAVATLAWLTPGTSANAGQLNCQAGYTCWADTSEADLVWVKKDDGNVNGPSCEQTCQYALTGNADYYACDEGRTGIDNWSELQPIANGMGFNCNGGYNCWGLQSPVEGQMLVMKGNSASKSCYFMGGDSFRCDNNPGNANCYGERYSSICPCKVTALDDACVFSSPPHYPSNPSFDEHADPSATDCLNRINYYRKRACDEGWRECPEQGLPPITECTCCHECANSESVYDKQYGAHKSFTRCGEYVQGQGGGGSCAAVIDQFVSERYSKTDENGQYICDGHCGPILKPGCWAFHWGKDPNSGFHTLNWRSCDWQKCNNYCNSPYSNSCPSSDQSVEPNLCGCDQPNANSWNCDGSQTY